MTDYVRFLASVDSSGGPDACHVWTGTVWQHRGYGRFQADGKSWRAHRWLLVHLSGEPLRPGEMVLHRCDNPPCVNPRHLYIGDHAQNMRDKVVRRRAWSPLSRANSAKTHCIHGHPFTPENTYIRRERNGKRRCRTCLRRDVAAYKARKRREVAK